MRTLSMPDNSNLFSTREAMKLLFGGLAAYTFAGCKKPDVNVLNTSARKDEQLTLPGTTDNTGSSTEMEKRVAVCRDILAKTFAQFNPKVAESVTSMPIGVKDLSDVLTTANAFVAGGWSPKSHSIDLNPLLAKEHFILFLVALGHEFIHSGKDLVEIRSLSKRGQLDAEISTYSIQGAQLIPAIEKVMEKEGRLTPEDRKMLRKEALRTDYNKSCYLAKRDILLEFEKIAPALVSFTSGRQFQPDSANTLIAINKTFNDLARAKLLVGHANEYAELVRTIESATSNPELSEAFSGLNAKLPEWKKLVSELYGLETKLHNFK